MSIRLAPRASRDRIGGVVVDAKGKGVLRVAVTAVPEQGRANKALISLLAKEWKLAKSNLTLVRGAKDRDKTVLIRGADGEAGRRLEKWAESLS